MSVAWVGGWVGAGVSDIWEEEEKKTGAKLISVWATFSSSLVSSQKHKGGDTNAAFHGSTPAVTWLQRGEGRPGSLCSRHVKMDSGRGGGAWGEHEAAI